MRDEIALALHVAGTMTLGFLIGANVFEQIYVIPGCFVPGGIATWKAFSRRNAAFFFIPLAASSTLCLVVSTALKSTQLKLAAMSAVVAAALLSAGYIIPRIRRAYSPRPGQTETETLRLLGQYYGANKLRLVIAFTGLVFALLALRGA